MMGIEINVYDNKQELVAMFEVENQTMLQEEQKNSPYLTVNTKLNPVKLTIYQTKELINQLNGAISTAQYTGEK